MVTKRKYILRMLLASLVGMIVYAVCIVLSFVLMGASMVMSSEQSPITVKISSTLSSMLVPVIAPILYATFFSVASRYLKIGSRAFPINAIIFFLLNMYILYVNVSVSVLLFANDGKSVTGNIVTATFSFLFIYCMYTFVIFVLNPIKLSDKIAGESGLHHPNLS